MAGRVLTLDVRDAVRKAWLTKQAECALAGFPAILTKDDAGRPMLVVSRWALTRSFTDLEDIRHWLMRTTGAPA